MMKKHWKLRVAGSELSMLVMKLVSTARPLRSDVWNLSTGGSHVAIVESKMYATDK
jgi:hypothetical protein